MVQSKANAHDHRFLRYKQFSIWWLLISWSLGGFLRCQGLPSIIGKVFLRAFQCNLDRWKRPIIRGDMSEWSLWQYLIYCQGANSKSELSQLLFISVRQRELIRVLASLVCLLIHNSLGLCTNYPTLPTKLCVTCPVMWYVTVMWHDLLCDPVMHYVTWCNRVSHAINRKVK